MPRPKRDSQQRATRNTFIQKGAEVQKIDQGGIWAQIVDSYPNPDFESVCFSQEVGSGSGNDDEFVSVAKWVYKCRRLIRKSGHIVASIRNGEIFHPCYFVEPSTEKRFDAGTIVWLEPLPQLNGYLMIPGGISRCHPIYGYDYGYYGSGSDIGSGYLDYGSGIGSGSGASGLVDCASLLNCLCVQKDSQGRVTGVFIKNPDGSLTEIMDCGSGIGSGIGGGSGSGGCCPQNGSEYVLEYDFVVSGRTFSGVSYSLVWMWGITGQSFTIPNPPCDNGPPPVYLFVYFSARCENGNIYPSITLVCGTPFCTLNPDDFEVTVTGCPGNPTIYLTIRPGRCASGSFVLRPA